VTNAAQAIAPRATATGVRGLVRVAARAEGDRVRISIADNGEGIRPEHRARLFEPLFTMRPGHAGLGLALAHRVVVARHGGRLEVESEPGRGATFHVLLPVSA